MGANEEVNGKAYLLCWMFHLKSLLVIKTSKQLEKESCIGWNGTEWGINWSPFRCTGIYENK